MRTIKELEEVIKHKKQQIANETQSIRVETSAIEDAIIAKERVQERIWRHEEIKEQAVQAKRIYEHELEDLMGELEEAEEDWKEVMGSRTSVKVARVID